MFIKYTTLIGKQSCLTTKNVHYRTIGESMFAEFICNDTWSKVVVPVEDLISITEIPDLPHLAFIPKTVWELIKDYPEIKDKDIHWHNDNLYCWEKDNIVLGKILRSLNMVEEIIVNDLPLGY